MPLHRPLRPRRVSAILLRHALRAGVHWPRMKTFGRSSLAGTSSARTVSPSGAPTARPMTFLQQGQLASLRRHRGMVIHLRDMSAAWSSSSKQGAVRNIRPSEVIIGEATMSRPGCTTTYRGRPLAEVSASRRGRASRAKLTAAPFGFALSADDAMMTMNSCGSRGEMGHSSAGAALGSSRPPPPAAPTLSYRPPPRLGFVRRQRSSRPRVWATRRPPTPNMTVGLHAFASAARRT